MTGFFYFGDIACDVGGFWTHPTAPHSASFFPTKDSTKTVPRCTAAMSYSHAFCVWAQQQEHKKSSFLRKHAWWLIPLSKGVITPVISGITLLIPFITGVITYLLSGMSHQLPSRYDCYLHPSQGPYSAACGAPKSLNNDPSLPIEGSIQCGAVNEIAFSWWT
jgi:hypothetical protein